MASLLSKATKGVQSKPIKAVIYGLDGCGKTSFAAQAPNPIFVGNEDGSGRYGATETPVAKTFEDLTDTIKEIIACKQYKTLVVDALDGVEALIDKTVCREQKVKSIEDINYGKGVVMSCEKFRDFIDLCNHARDDAGMNVIMIAHSHVKAMNDPSQPAPYDRHQLKLRDKNAACVREWADSVLFSCFETFVKTDKNGNKGKGFGDGKRVMFTERRPAYDAKNRDGLPHKMDLSWKAFSEALNRPSDEIAKGLINDCHYLIDQVEDTELKALMEKTVADVGTDVNKLREVLNRIKARVE